MCASGGGCYALVIRENGASVVGMGLVHYSKLHREQQKETLANGERSDRDVMNQLCPSETCPEPASLMDLMKPTRCCGHGCLGRLFWVVDRDGQTPNRRLRRQNIGGTYSRIAAAAATATTDA
ncbi:uncharacterized protein LOC118510788 [Anopheles stephensi]|uniref:uncharacterized protein LOC118510788 n=1 Tax=Anopheles stephensi TaxID=30069 RepID=UPI001658B19F|nr:uncharacterized protein LOC118510788 [Anopheles stephensi]